MPVTYRIEPEAQFIHTRCSGPVVLNEVREHFITLSHDPACPSRLDVLLDLSEMTTVPGSGELRIVAADIARIRPRITFGSCAIVAPATAVFGMSRMFEIFVEKYFAATHVFRSEAEATRWLAHRRDRD
jgi:hypothetical protein